MALQDLHQDPERLRTPIRRTDKGWQPMTWDDAFDLAAQRLDAIRRQHGRNSLGVYLGNPNVHNHGAMIAMTPFLRALGTRNRFSATSNDQLPHMLASLERFGHQILLPIPDLDHTDVLICIGANPVASNGSLMTVPDIRRRLNALTGLAADSIRGLARQLAGTRKAALTTCSATRPSTHCRAPRS